MRNVSLKINGNLLILFLVSALLILGGCASSGTVDSVAVEKYNRNFIKSFYQEIFNERKLDRAKQYIADDYIQHNPWSANGRQAFEHFFKFYFKENPEFTLTIKRIIADDTHVVVHAHGQKNAKDKGVAVVDIYRIENEKIVEHWDVLQNVNESVKNDNTMF